MMNSFESVPSCGSPPFGSSPAGQNTRQHYAAPSTPAYSIHPGYGFNPYAAPVMGQVAPGAPVFHGHPQMMPPWYCPCCTPGARLCPCQMRSKGLTTTQGTQTDFNPIIAGRYTKADFSVKGTEANKNLMHQVRSIKTQFTGSKVASKVQVEVAVSEVISCFPDLNENSPATRKYVKKKMTSSMYQARHYQKKRLRSDLDDVECVMPAAKKPRTSIQTSTPRRPLSSRQLFAEPELESVDTETGVIESSGSMQQASPAIEEITTTSSDEGTPPAPPRENTASTASTSPDKSTLPSPQKNSGETKKAKDYITSNVMEVSFKENDFVVIGIDVNEYEFVRVNEVTFENITDDTDGSTGVVNTLNITYYAPDTKTSMLRMCKKYGQPWTDTCPLNSVIMKLGNDPFISRETRDRLDVITTDLYG